MRLLLIALVLAAATCLSGTAHAQAAASNMPDKAEVAHYAKQLLADTYPLDGPGAAVLVARGDKLLYRGARGMADIAAGTSLTADDTFRLGSVTKQFAAAGLLKLVEAGKVALDDPLSKFLPDYPNGDHISVLQLLNHTSGVKSYTGIPGYMDAEIRKDLDTAALVDVFKNLPVDFAPGTDWAYNNSGYVLVGAVIEAASGKPWHQYLNDVLFKPLGMTDTGYGADPAVVTAQVQGYTFEHEKPVPAQPLSMTQPHAAGALVSSVDDLLTWNRALHEGKVLHADTYRQMITPVGKAVPAHYGFGIGHDTLRGRDVLMHGGGIPGFSSQLMYFPGADISVAVLHNADGPVPGEAGTGVLAAKLAAFALGDPYPAAVAIDVGIAALHAAEGVYRIDENTTRVLQVIDGKLTARRSGGPRSHLLPIGKDEFLYENSLTRIVLQRDADGKVSGMHIYQGGDSPPELTPRTDEPLPADRQAIELPQAALERVLGTYANGPMELKIFLDGEQLKAQMTGQPALDIFAESAHTFFLTVVDASLQFAPLDGIATTVTLSQNGMETVFKRSP